MSHIAGVLQRMDVQDVDVVSQDVALEVDEAAGGSVLDQLDEGLALHDIDVQIEVLLAGAVIVEQQLRHTAIGISSSRVWLPEAANNEITSKEL